MTKEENILNLANKLGAKIKIEGTTILTKKPVFQLQKVAKQIGFEVKIKPEAFRKITRPADPFAPTQPTAPAANTHVCPFCKKPVTDPNDEGYTSTIGFFHLTCKRQKR